MGKIPVKAQCQIFGYVHNCAIELDYAALDISNGFQIRLHMMLSFSPA
jgi:hypothetical protein